MGGGTYTIIPDQIEAGTYMAAVTAAGGEVLIRNVIPKHLECITAKLEEMGVEVEEKDDAVLIRRLLPLRHTNVKTMPYPGFPTDMQPQIAACLCLADGTSILTEGIWDNRYRYVDELKRLGARIQVNGKVAVVEGVQALMGAPIRACDLRAGAAMVVAGLAACGVTEIDYVHHIERGYEDIVEKIRSIGGNIQVIELPTNPIRNPKRYSISCVRGSREKGTGRRHGRRPVLWHGEKRRNDLAEVGGGRVMQLCTLASSSSGNCMLISHCNTHILVDAGISGRRIACGLNRLGLRPEQLSAVLITHEHSDHIGGLAMLMKRQRIPVWASGGTGRHLAGRIPSIEGMLHTFPAGGRFSVADMEISSFRTPHDAAESVGFLVRRGEHRIAVVTDLGYVPEHVQAAVRGADLLVLESNHDIGRLKAGGYPYYLKKRILGDRGHLSNEDAAKLACASVGTGTRRILLAHLSRENNTPQLALTAVTNALSGIGASTGRDVLLCVAPREENSPVFAL
jgi:phosphoribosyl 1,2-cyclic phosphodiesterase